MRTSRKCPNHPCQTVLFPCIPLILKKRKDDDPDTKRKKEGVNVVIPFIPSADNSNLSADGEDSFISVDMDSAMPSPFSEVRMYETLLVCTSWTRLNCVILIMFIELQRSWCQEELLYSAGPVMTFI